tara:strand:- start:6832 stop:7698 length:867 start_codon:yes stop_codon:yes gene_type:complete
VKKLKHSKFKNTGILFELLIRQITADILDSNESAANKLVKKYFAEDTDLGKEQRLYQVLLEETTNTEGSAYKLVDAVVSEHNKLDNRILSRLRYELVKEMKDVYPIDDFFRSKIRNYKTYASIYKLFEGSKNDVFCDPREIVESKNTIVNGLCRDKVINDELGQLENYAQHNEDLRLISYKLLVDRFNEKYSELNEDQRLLLKNYINNISNTNSLREYINEQLPIIKTKIEKLGENIDDEVVKIKLKEVTSQLNKVREGRVVKDSQVSAVLMSYELIKELEKNEQSTK